MILYDKIMAKYVIPFKIKKNLDSVKYMRVSLKENGLTDEEIKTSICFSMKETQSKIFKLKRDLHIITKK